MTRQGRLTAEEMVQQFENGKEGNDGWYRSDCPLCNANSRPLVFKDLAGGGIYIHCHGGCSEEAIRQMLADRGITVAPMPCTVETMAAKLRVPEDFLRKLGWKNSDQHNGSVAIPYYDSDGTPVKLRYRIALSGSDKFRWQKDGKTCLYGLHRLRDLERLMDLDPTVVDFRTRKPHVDPSYITIVEGETDSVTLWYRNFPALGLPGNQLKDDRDAGYLDGIKKIFVLIEPGKSGEGMLNWLRKSKIRDRAWLLRMPKGLKDVAALYQDDPEQFDVRFRKCLQDAMPWAAYAESSQIELKETVKEQAARLLALPDILSEVVKKSQELGITGEERNIKLVYLIATSRILDKIASLIVKGPSASGKSYLVEIVLRLFPDDAYVARSALSEKALVYTGESLKHRMFVLYEAVALEGFLAYMIRELQSRGTFCYEVSVKGEDGRIHTEIRETEGPTGFIVTTTAAEIHNENETRCLSTTTDDSSEQTSAIMRRRGRRARRTPDPIDLGEWHALQQHLALSDNRTSIPFGEQLGDMIKPVAIRLRRDIDTILALIDANALLHQRHRGRNDQGEVIATIEDYGQVRELVDDLLSETIEVTVPKPIERVWGAVQELLDQARDRRQQARDAQQQARREGRASVGLDPDMSLDEDFGSVTVRDIAKHLGIARNLAQRYAKTAIERGHLREAKSTSTEKRIILGDPPMSGMVRLLPSTAQLIDEIYRRDASSAEMRIALGLEPPPKEPEDEAPEDEAPAGDGC